MEEEIGSGRERGVGVREGCSQLQSVVTNIKRAGFGSVEKRGALDGGIPNVAYIFKEMPMSCVTTFPTSCQFMQFSRNILCHVIYSFPYF